MVLVRWGGWNTITLWVPRILQSTITAYKHARVDPLSPQRLFRFDNVVFQCDQKVCEMFLIYATAHNATVEKYVQTWDGSKLRIASVDCL